jgi:hypothetical protein
VVNCNLTKQAMQMNIKDYASRIISKNNITGLPYTELIILEVICA